MKKIEFIVLGLLFSAIFLGYEFFKYKQSELDFYKEKSTNSECSANYYFLKYIDCKNKK